MHAGKMEPENRALQTRHSGWLGQLSLDLLVAKEPQNPHSGSKLSVPEQPLITRPRTLEKPVLTLPLRKQCLQTKLGQRDHILVERKGLEQLDRLLVLSPAKAT